MATVERFDTSQNNADSDIVFHYSMADSYQSVEVINSNNVQLNKLCEEVYGLFLKKQPLLNKSGLLALENCTAVVFNLKKNEDVNGSLSKRFLIVFKDRCQPIEIDIKAGEDGIALSDLRMAMTEYRIVTLFGTQKIVMFDATKLAFIVPISVPCHSIPRSRL